MARPKKEKQISTLDQIDELLQGKDFKDKHFGGDSGSEMTYQPSISTGSLMFDYTLSQGLGGNSRGYKAGSITRMQGPEQTGKSSMGLTFAKNWQKTMPNPFVIIGNHEARITLDLINRVGIDTSKGCFRRINTNNGDMFFTLLEKLISNNPDEFNYFILLDSSDALNRQSDLDKGIDEAQKIAGGALLTSVACKRLSLPLLVGSHHLFITSQLRAKMTPSMGGMGPTTSPSGGNALKYYSSLIGSIKRPWSDTYIFEDPNNKKSKRLGNNVEIMLEKSYNEQNGQLIKYPVKYGQSGGIWKELEILDLCISWNLLNLEGRTYKFAESFRSDVHDKGFDLLEKVVGMPELINFYNTNPKFIEIATLIFENLLFSSNGKKLDIPIEELTEEIE